MNNILTALATKMSTSTFLTNLSGRIWLDSYQGDLPIIYPYCIYSVVTAPLEKTFTEEYRNTLIQFTICSSSSSAVEITGLYGDLKTLLDDQSLGTITSNTLVSMKEENLVTTTEEITASDGSQVIKVWHVDYEIITSKS
jgi:hypothetical protein